jgi:hypothetical protein
MRKLGFTNGHKWIPDEGVPCFVSDGVTVQEAQMSYGEHRQSGENTWFDRNARTPDGLLPKLGHSWEWRWWKYVLSD